MRTRLHLIQQKIVHLLKSQHFQNSRADEDESERASNMLSAASIPLFMALCVPLIFGTLRKPAAQPIKHPPGNVSFGKDWKPPSLSARAPYPILKSNKTNTTSQSQWIRWKACFHALVKSNPFSHSFPYSLKVTM